MISETTFSYYGIHLLAPKLSYLDSILFIQHNCFFSGNDSDSPLCNLRFFSITSSTAWYSCVSTSSLDFHRTVHFINLRTITAFPNLVQSPPAMPRSLLTESFGEVAILLLVLLILIILYFITTLNKFESVVELAFLLLLLLLIIVLRAITSAL
jgi:hypothetical protein